MCGRTACTLAPDEVCKACSVRTVRADGKKFYQSLPWRDHPNDRSYSPSSNMGPTRFMPVIISEQQERGVKRTQDGEEQPPNRVIQPMMWGLIPPFHKGPSPTGHRYSTTNGRIEDVETKAMYKPCLAKGQRCVVLCDGFYEWQTTKGDKNKQPYFIYSPQPKEVEIWNRDSWDKPGIWSEEEGWKGPQLLKMAGLYSYWKSSEGEEVMSYSVLTTEASKKFSSLHHRVPVILETDEEVETWLDSARVNYKEALQLLRKKEEADLEWHPVSTNVNNVRNQQPDLQQPISLEKKLAAETASSRFMSAWLGKASAQESKTTVKKETHSVKEEVKEEINTNPH